MTAYGSRPFTEWFYKNLGSRYLRPHHDGLVSLFETINKELPQHLNKIDQARKLIK